MNAAQDFQAKVIISDIKLPSIVRASDGRVIVPKPEQISQPPAPPPPPPQIPLPPGVTDLQTELRNRGFDSGKLLDLVQFGSAALKQSRKEEQTNFRQADEFEKPNVQKRINAIEAHIRAAQLQIAAKTFFGEYTYSASTVRNSRAADSSFTMTIPTGFTGINSQQVATVSFPMPDVSSRRSPSGQNNPSALVLTITGSINSLQELAGNSNSYRARILFNNLRYSDNLNVEADVLVIGIIEVR